MEPGLYLVATPIGNLDDMTIRAIDVLKSVDIIGAEDTRHSRILTQHFQIDTPLISYHEHNKKTRGEELLEILKSGKTVAVISDAGTPGISDPGADLACLCIENGIPVHPLPGGNAVLSAVIASGLDCRRFTFFGFLPPKGKERKDALEEITGLIYTFVVYVPPHRLCDDLKDLKKTLGNRKAALCRELTKIHESFYYGTLEELCELTANNHLKGEMVLVIEGAPAEAVPEFDENIVREELKNLMAQGVKAKTAATIIAEKYNVKKNKIYPLTIQDL